MQEIIKHGQSLIDISLQYTGSLESLFAHAAPNNMAISDDVNTGDNIEVILPDVQPEVVAYLVKNEKIIAASNIDKAPSGIGNMIIEGSTNPFKVK